MTERLPRDLEAARRTDPITLRLPKPLGRRLRDGAADRGVTLSRLMALAVWAYLDGGVEGAEQRYLEERRRRIQAEQTIERIRAALPEQLPAKRAA